VREGSEGYECHPDVLYVVVRRYLRDHWYTFMV
jgi:hypothetical protein